MSRPPHCLRGAIRRPIQRCGSNPRFVFDTVAGRYIVLCFLGTAADDHAQAALKAARSRPGFFDDATASFFAVTSDPDDEAQNRITEERRMPRRQRSMGGTSP